MNIILLLIIAIIIGIVIYLLLNKSKANNDAGNVNKVCNGNGYILNNQCECVYPWTGDQCQYLSSINNMNIDVIQKSLSRAIDQVNKNTTQVNILGKINNFYITNASSLPSMQLSKISETVSTSLNHCVANLPQNTAFFTYNPQTKQCVSYSQPMQMSLSSLQNGNLIIGSKTI